MQQSQHFEKREAPFCDLHPAESLLISLAFKRNGPYGHNWTLEAYRQGNGSVGPCSS